MSLISVPKFVCEQLRGMCLGAVSVASLCLIVTQAEAAVPSITAAPAAVAQAQAYVNTNRGKGGARFLSGRLHGGGVQGGASPVAFSVISIYAAGTSGYGNAALVGLGYSDQNGNINAIILAKPDQELYLVANGGFAGSSTYNTAIGLSAPLGTLATLPAAVVVNEATTVGGVYALAQFLDSSGQKPGTSVGNVSGLSNAFAVFSNLADLSSGTAATALPGGAFGSPPTATVNTLANVLASCVGSGSAASSQCTSLLAAATPAGGKAPANTLAAALDIARNEGNNVATLYALAGSGPFTPALTAAPNDWSVAIQYNGGALDPGTNAFGLAIDATGGAWVSSSGSASTVNGGNGFVLRLSPTGVQGDSFTDNGNIVVPESVAVDASGQVWVSNLRSASSVNGGLGTISGLTAAGAPLAGSPFSSGVQLPTNVLTDHSGNVWVLNSETNFLTKLPVDSGYAPVSFTVNDGQPLVAIFGAFALDGSGNVYAADGNNQVLVALSAADPSQQLPGSPFPGVNGRNVTGLGVDASGNVWQTAGGTAGITQFVKSASFAATQFLSNDLVLPGALAIDGAGSLWVANEDLTKGLAGVVPLSNSGASLSGSAGTYVGGGTILGIARAVAIDGSGNVWLTTGSNGVVELVGAATPVTTPAVGAPQLP